MQHNRVTSTKASGPSPALQTPPPSMDGSWTSALELRQVPLKPPDSPTSPRTRACRTTVVSQAAGVKRGRSETTAAAAAAEPPHQYDWFWDGPLTLSSSDNESCDSVFATGSSFAEPEDSSLVSLIWDPGSSVGRLRASLLDPAYTWFTSWRAIAHYAVPPDDRLPPRKRARISAPGHSPPSSPSTPTTASSPTSYVKPEDEGDSDLVFVSSPRGFFHLACPFYVSNPESHRRCAEQHDLGSVGAVRRHLRRDHQLPPYCGNCRRIFARAADRDRHHGLRACESRKWIQVEGLDERQRHQLRRSDKPYLGETRQWMRVWDVVFPKAAAAAARPSPYLTGGVGLAVSMLRDFWAGNGRDIVVQALGLDPELQEHGGDEAVVAWLGQAVLEDLVARAVEDHRAGKEMMS